MQTLDEVDRHVTHEFEIAARFEQRHIEFDLQPCRLYCDIDEVGMLIRNLLDNALRYTLAGGRRPSRRALWLSTERALR